MTFKEMPPQSFGIVTKYTMFPRVGQVVYRSCDTVEFIGVSPDGIGPNRLGSPGTLQPSDGSPGEARPLQPGERIVIDHSGRVTVEAPPDFPLCDLPPGEYGVLTKAIGPASQPGDIVRGNLDSIITVLGDMWLPMDRADLQSRETYRYRPVEVSIEGG